MLNLFRRIAICIIFGSIIWGGGNPKNIILLIGDGMGTTQLSAYKINNGQTNFDRFSIAGFSVTCSADNLITDSAAGATALSCGEHTNNGFLSVDVNDSVLKTAFEYAKDNSLSTGLVVTSKIYNATPAAFCSHVNDRHNSAEIARQLIESDVDIFVGGGREEFSDTTFTTGKNGEEVTLREALNESREIITSLDDFLSLEDAEKTAIFLADNDLPYAEDRDYSLADLVNKTIEILSSKGKGFFLMVEGSKIDAAGHNNEFTKMMNEIDDFDSAVGAAMDFAESGGETLVVVTADHETGGMSLTYDDIVDAKFIKAQFSTKGHTAQMVPLFAYGPKSERFGGIKENVEIGKLIINLVK